MIHHHHHKKEQQRQMASSSKSITSHSKFSVECGIQTEELNYHDGADKKLYESDSDNSFGLKSLYDDSDDCSGLDTDLESICSSDQSCPYTRRDSCISDSDLEGPLHLLFQQESSSFSTTRSVSRNSVESSSTTTSQTALQGVDTLLNRLTCERFLELRRLQLGERPVSSGNARQNLESFFHRAVYGPTAQERIELEEAIRPDNVVNDVNILQQQSIVRSALQNDFRRRLESALGSRISSTSSNRTEQQFTRSVNRTRDDTEMQQVGGLSFRNRLERMFQDRVSQVTPSIPRQRLQSARIQQRSNQFQRNVPPPPPVLSQNISQQPQEPSNLQISIEAGLQLLTESITEDLTRLQSLQVVSNMLRTDFREELENMVQSRVENVGNGPAVQNFVRSLPQQSRQRPQNQNSELRSSSNHAASTEIQSLRQQLDEMKRMMAMSMEIQMDTQRAIRQEVSAIFSAFMQDYLIPRTEEHLPRQQPTAFYPPRSTAVTSGQCVICIDRNVDTVLYQCGHMCVCHQCGLQLKTDGHNCPMCRAPIRDVIRAYQTQQ